MTATEEFEVFHARRNDERAERDAAYVSWRKAKLPGFLDGYVARRGESRAYVRRVEDVYEYGRIVGKTLVPAGRRPSLYDAKRAASELLAERAV